MLKGIISIATILVLAMPAALAGEVRYLACINDSTVENGSSFIELNKLNDDTYSFKFFMDGFDDIIWNLTPDDLHNNNHILLRIYRKSFGILNWESIDLRYFKEINTVSFTYQYKDTSWQLKSSRGRQDVVFSDCEVSYE